MRIRNFLFDLDGTITNIELLPEIARIGGVEKEISELTRKTIAGEVPFESSLRRRVELLSNVSVCKINELTASVSLDPFILNFITSNRDRCTIVTGNLDVWITPIIHRIGVPALTSQATVVDDRIKSLDFIMDKGKAIAGLRGPFCAIGDGNNDRGMFEVAELSVAYGGVNRPAASLYEVATHVIFDSSTLCQFLSQL